MGLGAVAAQGAGGSRSPGLGLRPRLGRAVVPQGGAKALPQSRGFSRRIWVARGGFEWGGGTRTLCGARRFFRGVREGGGPLRFWPSRIPFDSAAPRSGLFFRAVRCHRSVQLVLTQECGCLGAPGPAAVKSWCSAPLGINGIALCCFCAFDSQRAVFVASQTVLGWKEP